jgi:catechol 2,3-dioxygenase-like lactoylglutathione lyase family enzyme/uncharacterized protein YndB with AHSA1/START domain
MDELPLCQIAISVADVQRSQRWYRDVFGYRESGGTSLFIPLFGSADVQGVPDATSVCWWMMDRQEFFQLELFQFTKPPTKPLPADWRPCDIGYTTIGIHVADFDATLQRLARRRVVPVSDPVGDPGVRRVCVRDPDGVLLEIMEDDPRSEPRRPRPYEAEVVTRFVTLSVPDLERARRTWIDVLELPEEHEVVLHTPEHERLWGLEGASRDSFVLRAGDLFIEAVQYLDPVGKPWPDGYRISDHGLLNIALGLRSLDAHEELLARCIEAGLHPNTTKPTLLRKAWYASYVNDPLGFSIELLYHATPGRGRRFNPFDLLELGFVPGRAPIRRSSAEGLIAAPPERVWEILTDHVGMAVWSPFETASVLHRPYGGGEVGTVRRLGGGPLGVRTTEIIVTADRPYRLEYNAEALPGIWFFHGFVTLEPTPGGGTTVVWEAQFRSPLPGAGAIVSSMLRSLVTGLTTSAEQPPLDG